MVVRVTCKTEEDSIKKEGPRVEITLFPVLFYGDFSRRSRAGNSAGRDQVWPNFKFIRDFMVVLITCKNNEDPIKT